MPQVRHTQLEEDFSVRAIVLGLAIGCLLCFTNLYFGLQTGWISMMSLQSALIGYILGRLFSKPFSPQENVLLQTTATAAGTMPLAAGFVGILPALTMLEKEKDGSDPITVNWFKTVCWSLAIAFFGVFLSPPLRKQVIIKEKLAFPSGTATAQLISLLYQIPQAGKPAERERDGYQALNSEDGEVAPVPTQKKMVGWATLVYSFSISATMTFLAYFFPALFTLPVFGTYLAKQWLWYFTPSLSYVGQGIIMGFPTTLSMNLGMLVGWGLLSPLSKYMKWAPGPVDDMTTGARGWILWVSLSIMVIDSLVSLAPVVFGATRKLFLGLSGRRTQTRNSGVDEDDDSDQDELHSPDQLVPQKWITWGLSGTTVLGIILVWAVFGAEGIKPWATLFGFIFGGVLSILGVRALGETDLNPVSGLGKISQLLFAFLQPGNVVANLIAGGVAEAGAQQAGDLMQDLKTGYLLGASPRALFSGQLIGSAFSIVVTATAYQLYLRAYPIPGPTFPAPTAFVWLSLARLLRSGHLPAKSAEFMVGFGVLFALVASLKIVCARMKSPYTRWIPSGVAFAIGFLNTPSFSIARLIGGIIEYIYRRRMSEGQDDMQLIIIASGFVLGEGVTSVISLILKTWGIGVASCWGCADGLCGGCP